MKNLKSIALAVFIGCSPVVAQDALDLDTIAKVDLITGWPLESGGYMGALRVTLEPGWKTYWRVANETGIPPRIDWHGSENLADVNMFWPRPDILTTDGVLVVGYKNELILPIEFRPSTAGEDIHVSGSIQLGVCSDICVPVHVPLDQIISFETGPDSFLIELALADGAEAGAELGYKAHSCRLNEIENGFQLEMQISLPTDADNSEFIMLEITDPTVWIPPAEFTHQGDEIFAETSLLSYENEAFEIDPNDLRITLISKKRTIELQGCPLADAG
ncbi:MAG: DsbC/DsbD-like thiol-disulfide interchange protein [Paracoccaceae bacterium]|jgi:DsbC/DsbD-like thiol-disulfide interchange protein